LIGFARRSRSRGKKIMVMKSAGRGGIRLREQTTTKPKPMVQVVDLISDEPFCLTYGDGVGDVDIGRRVEFHGAGDAWLTLTAVQPPGRYRVISIDGETRIPVGKMSR
jgi:NDP-sugar pyrophosphorylase family protein